VLYLSQSNGIIYADDVIEQTKKSVSTYTKEEFSKWSAVVSEEIVRQCLRYSTANVCLMCRYANSYRSVIQMLKLRGVNITTPIMGVSEKMVEKILSC
jgi:hypothetical protein